MLPQTERTHRDLHSEQGALPGEHTGRSRNPVIKAVDIAWLEFEKPDLTRCEAFARAFGFQAAQHRPDEIQLRGTHGGAPCVIVRRGPRTRFSCAAFRAGDEADVLRLYELWLKTGSPRARQLLRGLGIEATPVALAQN